MKESVLSSLYSNDSVQKKPKTYCMCNDCSTNWLHCFSKRKNNPLIKTKSSPSIPRKYVYCITFLVRLNFYSIYWEGHSRVRKKETSIIQAVQGNSIIQFINNNYWVHVLSLYKRCLVFWLHFWFLWRFCFLNMFEYQGVFKESN